MGQTEGGRHRERRDRQTDREGERLAACGRFSFLVLFSSRSDETAEDGIGGAAVHRGPTMVMIATNSSFYVLVLSIRRPPLNTTERILLNFMATSPCRAALSLGSSLPRISSPKGLGGKPRSAPTGRVPARRRTRLFQFCHQAGLRLQKLDGRGRCDGHGMAGVGMPKQANRQARLGVGEYETTHDLLCAWRVGRGCWQPRCACGRKGLRVGEEGVMPLVELLGKHQKEEARVSLSCLTRIFA